MKTWINETVTNRYFVSCSCRYAGFLLGITNTFGTIPGVVAPIVTGYFTEDVSIKAKFIISPEHKVFLSRVKLFCVFLT